MKLPGKGTTEVISGFRFVFDKTIERPSFVNTILPLPVYHSQVKVGLDGLNIGR